MYMNYLTTTQLRTQTSKIVDTLKKKGTISLIHRSKIIGTINPVQKEPVKITDVKALEKFLSQIRPQKLIPQYDREKVYRQHLIKKYGKGISGH